MCRNWLDETPDWWAISTNPSLADLVWHTLKAEEAEKLQAMSESDRLLAACRAALSLLTNPDADDRDADAVTDQLRQAIEHATH